MGIKQAPGDASDFDDFGVILMSAPRAPRRETGVSRRPASGHRSMGSRRLPTASRLVATAAGDLRGVDVSTVDVNGADVSTVDVSIVDFGTGGSGPTTG